MINKTKDKQIEYTVKSQEQVHLEQYIRDARITAIRLAPTTRNSNNVLSPDVPLSASERVAEAEIIFNWLIKAYESNSIYNHKKNRYDKPKRN